MFCKECGAQLADDSKFCNKCGAKIVNDNEDTTALPTAEQSQEQPSNVEMNNNHDSDFVEQPVDNGQKSNKAIIIAGAVLACAVLLFFVFGSNTNNQQSDTKPAQTAETTNNQTLTREQLEKFPEYLSKKRKDEGKPALDENVVRYIVGGYLKHSTYPTEKDLIARIEAVYESAKQEVEKINQRQARWKEREERERQQVAAEEERRRNSPQNQLKQFIQTREPIMNKANDAFVALTATILDVVASPSPNQIPRLNQIIQALNETKAEYEDQILVPPAFTGDNALILDTVMKQDLGYMAFMKEYAEIHKRMLQGQATQQDRRNTSVCEEFIRKHGGVAILREFANRMGVNANIRY